MESEVAGEVASQIARMEITRPEVLRVTRAHQAFQRFARALRPGNKEDFHHKSFVSKHISSFWSHSWHGNHWMKILTLFFLHNGRASVLVGCFLALAMMVLFSLGMLPGWARDASAQHVLYSIWATGGGLLATSMTFLLWRSQRKVFFDGICINDQDHELKKASIYSLGGIVAHSQEMLVLWDSTWSERLWCQFELAAFLTKKTDKQVLVIRPTLLGPCSCLLFIAASLLTVPRTCLPTGVAFLGMMIFGLVCCYSSVAALRGYFRTLETLKGKMRNFSFEQGKSACCDMDHTHDGYQIMCDRLIVKECVSIWFGDQESFEDYVRSKVAENLTPQLENAVFTRWWSLAVTVPLLWSTFDLCATWIAVDEYEKAMARFLADFVIWFLCGPMAADYWIHLGQRFSQKPSSTACEIMKSLVVLLLAMIPLIAINCTALLWQTFPWGSEIERAGAFAGFWCFMAVGHLLLKEIVSRKRG